MKQISPTPRFSPCSSCWIYARPVREWMTNLNIFLIYDSGVPIFYLNLTTTFNLDVKLIH